VIVTSYVIWFLTEKYEVEGCLPRDPSKLPGARELGVYVDTAAFDRKRGAVFTVREDSLRAVSVVDMTREITYSELPPGTSVLAVDRESNYLFAVAGGRLHRWRLANY